MSSSAIFINHALPGPLFADRKQGVFPKKPHHTAIISLSSGGPYHIDTRMIEIVSMRQTYALKVDADKITDILRGVDRPSVEKLIMGEDHVAC